MPKTYCWLAVKLGDYSTLLEICGPEALQQEDWDARNALAAQLFREHHRDASRLRTFVVSDGGHPNARQRKELVTVVGGQTTRQAVVTCSISNPIIQGVVTALAWLNPGSKAVGPERWREAIAHVDLQPHVNEILDRMEELQKDMPPNQTLAYILKAADRRPAAS